MELRITPFIKKLSISFIVIFILHQSLEQFAGIPITQYLGLVPASAVLGGYFWQFFTYSFFHADISHLILNLMMLVFIGSELESIWGQRRFITYYFFCSVSSGVLYLFLVHFFENGLYLRTPLIGASGAIYGMLVAYGILFSERKMHFMMLFPLAAKHFVWILAGIEFLTSVFGARGQALSAFAHLGGLVAGFGYLWGRARWQMRQKSAVTKAKASASKVGALHLKLVVNQPDVKSARKKGGSDDSGDSSGNGPHTWH